MNTREQCGHSWQKNPHSGHRATRPNPAQKQSVKGQVV